MMSNYVAFHAQLTSIMEVLTKAAIAEICELVDDGYAVLHLEISRSQKENEALKRKLRMMELRAARGSWDRRRAAESHVKRLSSGVRLCDEFTGTARVRDFSIGCPAGVSLWADVDPPTVDEEDPSLRSAVCEKSADIEEERPEVQTIKKEGVDEVVQASDPHGGLKFNEERPVEAGGEKASDVDAQTEPVIGTEEPTVQQGTRQRVWEDSRPDTVLKAEADHESVNPQDTEGRLNSLENGYALYERPGQLDTFFTRGDSETETEEPACSYSPNTSSDSLPIHPELQLSPTAAKGVGDRLSPVGRPDVKPDIILIDSEPLTVDAEMHSAWTKESVPGVVHSQQRNYKEYGQREEFHPENALQMPVRECRTESNSQMNRRFTSGSRLKSNNRISSREKRFICGYCGKSFTCPKYLQTHQRVHTGEKPYSCMHCGKRFAQSSYLKKHQTVHTGEKPFSCAQCGKRFADSSNLIRHKSVHTGERPFICIHCGERFAGKHNLKIHQQRNHPSVWSSR